MKVKVSSAAALCAAAAAFAVAGCGSDDNSSSGSSSSSSDTTAETTPAPAPSTSGSGGGGGASSNLKVAADPSGQLKFTEDSLAAAAGKVTLKLTNASPVPHNIAVEGNGVQSDVSDTIQDGGTAEITVDLPAGTYTYYCRVHPFMRGAFRVAK
jgi:plastocyanin